MVWKVRLHRTNNRDVVDASRGQGKEFTNLNSALPVFLESKWGGKRSTGLPFRPDIFHRKDLTCVFLQRGLWIKSVHMRRATVQEKMDYPFCFSSEMGCFRRQRQGPGFTQQRAETQRPQ